MSITSVTRGLLLAGGLAVAAGGSVQAAGPAVEYPSLNWSFNGVFGSYDPAALQRGFQVYKEVCSACHGMEYLAYRNLEEIGFSPQEVRAIAAEYEVEDGPDEFGDMFLRPAIPADRFRQPFPNQQAARAANGGAYPTDLSLIAKQTKYGANYIYAVLTGYEDEPPPDSDVTLAPGQYYNKYKGAFGMAQPLWPDSVEYADGTPATVSQMSQDVSHFLMWAAEPHMETRKQTGIKAIIFLLIFTGILYAVKRKVWSDLK
ncbi:MAG: cytochrome c1 [Pseudomonadota bacterium]